MKVATVSLDTVWKDPHANIVLTEKHINEVKRRHPEVQLILFPEISLVGAVVDDTVSDLAEDAGGYCVTEVKRLAREHKVALVCGFIQRNDGGKPCNAAVAVNATGEVLGIYNKNHLFTASKEPELYSPGKELVTFELDGWKFGMSTCFDIRFPRLFEAYKKAGVECVVSGFNWVNGRNKPAIMENLIKARAHENQYFFVAVDRTGSDPNTSYYGTSVITNPFCEDIAERDDIYAYAELKKDEIATLAKNLPLTGSFKESYEVK